MPRSSFFRSSHGVLPRSASFSSGLVGSRRSQQTQVCQGSGQLRKLTPPVVTKGVRSCLLRT
ncbi:hypothetical protein C3489_19750 [Streptomyces sp. Ru71]|nr:hypothetical protein C3489_19750 [Streptomyces sp. Ru71]